MGLALVNWLKANEAIAIWLEGIALVLLFIWELRGRGELLKQIDIARKQIHADRVSEIFKVLRTFHNFLIDSVHRRQSFGPGKDYSTYGNISQHPEGRIFPEYLALQEAYYLSYLVSDPLAAYMKDRMTEADGLQRVDNSDEFYRKLGEFNEKWDVYKMAAKIRELS